MGVYSFLDNQATLSGPGGSPISLGAGAGVDEEGISVDFVEEKDVMRAGADGEVIHSLVASRMATVSVRLLKTSPVNAQLSALYAFQTASSLFHGKNTLIVSNSAMGDIITCDQVAFTKFPRIDYPKDARMNEWRFNAAKCYPTLGPAGL